MVIACKILHNFLGGDTGAPTVPRPSPMLMDPTDKCVGFTVCLHACLRACVCVPLACLWEPSL